MSFDDMANGNGVFFQCGTHLGFHLRARVVYKSWFYTQTLDITSEIENSPLSLSFFSLSRFSSLSLRFSCVEIQSKRKRINCY